jgi:hypothetical protein
METTDRMRAKNDDIEGRSPQAGGVNPKSETVAEDRNIIRGAGNRDMD